MTYGKIGPQGGIVPTVDRDGQTVDAARELGHIDWDAYIKGGVWNDTHDEDVLVGVPTNLEFHDNTTELAKSHGKVGFWTSGHLFDPNDPYSWQGFLPEDQWPTPAQVERSTHFWTLAHLLKGTPRPIGFSAHGQMALSPCKKRIIWARVTQSAVCELPVNPDATAEPLALARMAKGRQSPLDFIRKGQGRNITRPPCGNCSCPAGSCEGLAKAVYAGSSATSSTVPEDLEGSAYDNRDPDQGSNTEEDAVERILKGVMERFRVDRSTAESWLTSWRDERRASEEHNAN